MRSRQSILSHLQEQIKLNHHLLGVATSSGLIAKYAEAGGADFLMALNSGKYRQLGRSSFACFLAFENCNGSVMNFGTRELMPLVHEIPLLFGLNATDPLIDLKTYIEYIKLKGFDGINNYPSIGLIDGQFREALEEEGISYKTEVEAIRIAHNMDLFTVAFVFDENQTIEMIDAGADVICLNLGLTIGGDLGSKKIITLDQSKQKIEHVFNICDRLAPGIIKMIYGGAIKSPIDLNFIYLNTSAHGYIGGSSIERIPIETSIKEFTRAFKVSSSIDESRLMLKMRDEVSKRINYTEFVLEHIRNHFNEQISLNDLANTHYISANYLGSLFKKELGMSFKHYLVKFRIEKSIEILEHKKVPLNQLAEQVGYLDYSQFSKMFKKVVGINPTEYIKNNS